MVFEGLVDQRVVFRHFDSESSTSFCVNGTRAALDCLIEKDKVPLRGRVCTEGVDLEYIHSDGTQVFLDKVPAKPMVWEAGSVMGFFCDVGNPHFILLDDTHWGDFPQLAPKIRQDERTFPQGCNVSIVQKRSHCWRIRTYERGVEALTHACGSGVLATSLALFGAGRTGRLRFVPDGGEWIHVDDCGAKIALSGPTRWIASGVLR